MFNTIINIYKHPTLEVQIQTRFIEFFRNEHEDNRDKEEHIEKWKINRD